jgi:simple sugar transport system substrate-binding protein
MQFWLYTISTGREQGSMKLISDKANTAIRSSIALGIGAAVIALAGCAGTTDGATGAGCTTEPISQFAVVTPETEADHGWNAQAILGAGEAATALGITADINKGVGYDNAEAIVQQTIDKGNQFVIAHASGFATGGARVAETSGAPVLVVDLDQKVHCQVAGVFFDSQEGGYLAGIAAANATKTGTLGIVASAEDVNWFNMAGGFAQGAYSVNPDLKIVIAYIGPAEYGDSAGGKRITEQVIAAGADIIIGMGDGATVGYLQAIETASTPVQYIATIGDVADIDTTGVELTSVLWNFAPTYEQAIKDIDAGVFGDANYTLNVANGGLSLAKTANLTADVQAAVDAATKGIADGSITVKPATTKDAVQAIIDGK